MLGKCDARTAGPSRQDQHGRSQRGGDTELQLNRTIGVSGNERPNRVFVEDHSLWRSVHEGLALVGKRGIDFDEEEVARESAALSEPGPAIDVLSGRRPGGALFFREPAPPYHHAPKGRANAHLRGTLGIPWHRVTASDLAVARSYTHKRALSSGLGYIEYLHIIRKDGVVPGPVSTNAQAAAGVHNKPASH